MRAGAIRLARVPHRMAGAPRLRLGLEQWLADCDPAQHGLPSQAIVLVRHLDMRWRDVVDNDRATRYGRFAVLLAGAHRPARDNADADVVWFADEAELLACIARDALSGALSTRWWWRTLGTIPSQSLAGVAAWLQTPRAVPRAIQRLGARRAQQWLARWPAPDQAALLTALAQVFTIASEVATWVLQGAVQARSAAPARFAAAPSKRVGVAPPCGANEDIARSRSERLRLLCSELAVDAGAARTPDRAACLAAFLAALAGPRPQPWKAAEAARVEQRAVASGRSEDPAMAPRVRPTSATPQTAPRSEAAAVARQVSGAQASKAPRAATMPLGDLAMPSWCPTPLASPRRQACWSDTGESLAASPLPTSIDTRWGGLLFVLNAALQLSLYGDFTMPAHKGLACTPWRFLWLAGRMWCDPSFREDALFRWLARRDAAADRARAVLRETDWRIEPAWLDPFPATQAPWRASWRDGRFSLMHPAGFCVCNLAAAAGACEALIDNEAIRLGLGSRPRIRHTVVAGPAAARLRSPRLQRHGCPESLWPYLHARLALALDDGDPIPPRRRLASMLELPARLQDSGERLDLYLPLDALPLTVRLAGLDRDPGWVPAAGCDFRFHFG
ncbi:hypothetical protein QTI24_24570 [Variovorax sp. J22P240]|uniref:hypothetical protein n=1 Tax=Variovorax sp. J22P240 TaxID=3053514 RepID=UPI0025771697|nr:hypothetical protein [Variovorax sp. J22P240]MDM0001805.1 hypothetical protein [Variovorax sp. J22P240]